MSFCFAVTIKKDRFLAAEIVGSQKRPIRSARTKDIIKQQQAGNGEKAKEELGRRAPQTVLHPIHRQPPPDMRGIVV